MKSFKHWGFKIIPPTNTKAGKGEITIIIKPRKIYIFWLKIKAVFLFIFKKDKKSGPVKLYRQVNGKWIEIFYRCRWHC